MFVTQDLFQFDKEVVVNLFQICYRFVSNCMVIDGPELVMFFSMKGTINATTLIVPRDKSVQFVRANSRNEE